MFGCKVIDCRVRKGLLGTVGKTRMEDGGAGVRGFYTMGSRACLSAQEGRNSVRHGTGFPAGLRRGHFGVPATPCYGVVIGHAYSPGHVGTSEEGGMHVGRSMLLYAIGRVSEAMRAP